MKQQQQQPEENRKSQDTHTRSYRYYRQDSGATPQVKLPEHDQALRERYAYIKKRWLGGGAAHCVHARVISGCSRPNTP